MARPRKGEEKNRPCRMAFRTTEEVRAAIDAIAEAQSKSISDVLNELIEREIVRQPALAARNARLRGMA